MHKLVLYDERMVVSRRWPASTFSDARSFGGFEAEWTDQHQKLAGHNARKVLLRRRSAVSSPLLRIPESVGFQRR